MLTKTAAISNGEKINTLKRKCFSTKSNFLILQAVLTTSLLITEVKFH